MLKCLRSVLRKKKQQMPEIKDKWAPKQHAHMGQKRPYGSKCCSGKTSGQLLKRKTYWNHRWNTLWPTGLNEDFWYKTIHVNLWVSKSVCNPRMQYIYRRFEELKDCWNLCIMVVWLKLTICGYGELHIVFLHIPGSLGFGEKMNHDRMYNEMWDYGSLG